MRIIVRNSIEVFFKDKMYYYASISSILWFDSMKNDMIKEDWRGKYFFTGDIAWYYKELMIYSFERNI